MNVTKDVIKDLLPLYQAGEVSQDTRKLVDDYLGNDPELRQLVAAASSLRGDKINVRREIDEALATLKMTKRAMSRQKWTQFYAILFTLLPFSFMWKDGQLKYLVARDAPWSLIPLWGAATLLWYFYAKARRVGAGSSVNEC